MDRIARLDRSPVVVVVAAPDWFVELKYDGFRALTYVDGEARSSFRERPAIPKYSGRAFSSVRLTTGMPSRRSKCNDRGLA